MQKIFAFFIVLALLAGAAAAQEPPVPETAPAGAANPYVIYYGWLTDSARGIPNADARRIAAARPRIAVVQPKTAAPAGHLNISPQVLALLHSAGTSVYAYVSTRWTRTDVAHVLSATDEALATGADGILFDEADPLCTNVHYNYYRQLSERVRAAGKRIIFNTGVTDCGPRIMDLADYVMLEHQWRRTMPWMAAYPPERFMGVSSNEGRAMGYYVDERRAIADTREALQRGIGWHTSTDRYINLPIWFASHLRAVASGATPSIAMEERSAAVALEKLRRN
jgi:hypothetical protein